MAVKLDYDERLNLRLSRQQKALFERAAQRAEMTLSEWIRDQLRSAARRQLAAK